MTKNDRDFLFRLLETPSPTGFEMAGQRVWADFMKGVVEEVECDSYGSAWAVLPGAGSHTVMLESHADEIGYMIKGIESQGFLRLDRIGGSDVATSRGRRLTILGDKGPVTGIIGNVAIHLRKDAGAQEKVPQVHELWVDVGASNPAEVANLGIRVGHPAVYSDGPLEMPNRCLVGRALDNRIGGFIIAMVLKRLAKAKKKPGFRVVCLNSVQEEIGGQGAMMATHRLQPDVCLCVDVTHATDTPGMNHAKYGKVKLGGGPTLTHGTANHPNVVARLMEVAAESKVPIQHEASARYTGTDTDKIYATGSGVPSALVSLPLRYMHSIVETAHLDDVESVIELMAGFVESLDPEESFGHKL